MNRLEVWLKGTFKIEYPEDIIKLKEGIPELVEVNDSLIQQMYAQWSEDYYCASWHIMCDGVVEEFRNWLLSDVDPDNYYW